ncbi:MAG: glycosyltransferase family 2 protein [Planctomycetes bacterium]|nr:glycosyltransferase family 2 protein [Planctomycetota bacterium]
MPGEVDISVIMALRDEADSLPATLAALARQSLAPARWELVIALAAGDDAARALIEAARPGLPVLRLLDNEGLIAATGLNLALRAARGRFVARLDGHCEPAPDWLELVLARLETAAADCVGGPQRPEGRGPWGRAWARASRSLAGNGGAAFRRAGSEPRLVDTVHLGAWSRASLIELGGFDEGLPRNQDDELAMRLRARGGRILLDQAIRVIYRPRERLGGILRQYFAYGLWKPTVLLRHPGALRPRHLLPALVALWFLACLLEMLLISLPGGLLLLALWPLAVLLLLAPTLGGAPVTEMLRAWLVAALMTPAYGLGFILGTPRAFRARPRLLAAEASAP